MEPMEPPVDPSLVAQTKLNDFTCKHDMNTQYFVHRIIAML